MWVLPRILMIAFCLLNASTSLATQPAWHFLPSDVNSLHSKPADYRLPYGNDSLQFGDLRLPTHTKSPYPVAIIIHGGCWVSGFANIQNTAALADALRDMGIATWNIEYRREDNKGGGWPGTFEDVAHSADFLRKIARKYSLDLNRVIVIGHSAGGHLALWLAARHQLPTTSQLYTQQPLTLRGVIVLGGIPDLKAFRKQGEDVCGSDVVGKLLGSSANQVDKHYKEASPNELLPLGIPQILIYGTEDKSVPLLFGHSYMQTALKKGDTVKLVEVKYTGHHEYIVPNAVAWPAVKAAVLLLLNYKQG
ncbi:MAG: alpha/beta hydrolase [Gammaproteobacteria bacterium]